jgi:2-oxoisovalerate dehydrogenase E1 component
MSAEPRIIPARHKNVNRAQVCDENFVEFVRGWHGHAARKPAAGASVLPGSECSAASFLELFESQLISRHLDLMARNRS